MGSFAEYIPLQKSTAFLAIVACSVVLAVAATSSLTFAISVGGILLFALLVKDLRLIVPIVLVSGPLAPKFPMSFGNLYLTTAILIIAYAAWAWRGCLLRSSYVQVRSSTAKALVWMLVIMFLSTLQGLPYLAENPAAILRLIQFFLYTSLFFIVLQMNFTKGQIKGALAVALAVGVVEALIGLWQWFSVPGPVMIWGTFDYRHTHLGAHEMFIALIALGALLETRKVSLGLILSICVGFYLYAVVFSFTRTSYVALPVGLAVMFAMPFRAKRKWILLIAAAGAVLIIVKLVPAEIIERARTIMGNITGERVGKSFGTRLSLWKEGFREFLNQPLLGLGPWGYGLADSYYVKILAESGILGLLAYIYVLVAMTYEQWLVAKSRISDSFVRGIAYGLLPATVASIVIFGITAEIFAMHRFMSTFWIVFALLIKWVQNERVPKLTS